jgi:hypothetical protein
MYLNVPKNKIISNRGDDRVSEIDIVINEDIVFGVGNNIP